MRIYSHDDEENIRQQALLQEWRRSGFLDASQAELMEVELRTPLRQTNVFLRATLFLFTTVVVTVALLLTFDFFHLADRYLNGLVCGIAAVCCWIAAEAFIRGYQLYRFGVEEALATGAAVLMSISGGFIVAPQERMSSFELPFAVALTTAALVSLGVYRRFGYIYAAIASLTAAAAVPFALSVSGEFQRALAASVCAAVFLLVRPKRVEGGREFTDDDSAVVQAAAWTGIYVCLNLQLGWSQSDETGIFYWWTYLMCWLLPGAGLWLALSTKDRLLMNLCGAMTIVTLVTNKPYLHLARQPWDPLLLGLMLIILAVAIKRWLVTGPNQQRHGFTPMRLLAGDRRALAILGTASAALQPGVPSSGPATAKPEFDGGRSGGAGATGSF
jgi:hypothetical protein